jgi:hypothetical protein
MNFGLLVHNAVYIAGHIKDLLLTIIVVREMH